VSETKVPHTPYNCIIRKKYEIMFSSIEFEEGSEWNASLQMIAKGVSDGLFHIPEDVFPQHVTTTLDALKSVKNTSAKQLYAL
jgi:hypothetical protein